MKKTARLVITFQMLVKTDRRKRKFIFEALYTFLYFTNQSETMNYVLCQNLLIITDESNM